MIEMAGAIFILLVILFLFLSNLEIFTKVILGVGAVFLVIAYLPAVIFKWIFYTFYFVGAAFIAYFFYLVIKYSLKGVKDWFAREEAKFEERKLRYKFTPGEALQENGRN